MVLLIWLYLIYFVHTAPAYDSILRSISNHLHAIGLTTMESLTCLRPLLFRKNCSFPKMREYSIQYADSGCKHKVGLACGGPLKGLS